MTPLITWLYWTTEHPTNCAYQSGMFVYFCNFCLVTGVPVYFSHVFQVSIIDTGAITHMPVLLNTKYGIRILPFRRDIFPSHRNATLNTRLCSVYFNILLKAYAEYAASWWRHQMETFSAFWPCVRGIHQPPVISPAQRLVKRSFDFFYLCLIKRLRKQSWGWWFETLSRQLWRHCNVVWTVIYAYEHFGALLLQVRSRYK